MVMVWRKRNICALLVGLEMDTTTIKNSTEFPQKNKNKAII